MHLLTSVKDIPQRSWEDIYQTTYLEDWAKNSWEMLAAAATDWEIDLYKQPAQAHVAERFNLAKF